jgi:hypothetical protein
LRENSSRDRKLNDIAPLADAFVGLEINGFVFPQDGIGAQRCRGMNIFMGDEERLEKPGLAGDRRIG